MKSLKDFKKVSMTKHETVMRHPEGHEIILKHEALKPDHLKELHQMEFADGGTVRASSGQVNTKGDGTQPKKYIRYGIATTPDTDINNGGVYNANNYAHGGKIKQHGASGDWNDEEPASIMSQQQQQQSPDDAEPASMISQQQQPSQSTNMSMMSQQQQQPQSPSEPTNMSITPPQPQAQTPTQMTPEQMTQGINTQVRGIRQQAAAEGALGKQQAPIYENQANINQSLANATINNLKNNTQETENVVNDMKNNLIDPEHYMNSKSTFGKIRTAIGIVLAGIGSGITHQENPALKFLHDNIQRDVDAQVANQGTRKNLLTALNEQYGNQQVATKMLNAIYTAKTEDELRQAAAKSMDPMAQARALQAIGPLQQQKNMILHQVAQAQAITQHVNNGSLPPERAIPFLVPKEHQSKAFDDLGKLKAVDDLKADSLDAFDHIHSKFMNGVFSPNDVDSAKGAFIGKFQKLTEGRYNHDAVKLMADSLFPKKTDISEDTVANKRERMEKLFDVERKDYVNRLGAYGIKTPTTSGARPNRAMQR